MIDRYASRTDSFRRGNKIQIGLLNVNSLLEDHMLYLRSISPSSNSDRYNTNLEIPKLVSINVYILYMSGKSCSEKAQNWFISLQNELNVLYAIKAKQTKLPDFFNGGLSSTHYNSKLQIFSLPFHICKSQVQLIVIFTSAFLLGFLY